MMFLQHLLFVCLWLQIPARSQTILSVFDQVPLEFKTSLVDEILYIDRWACLYGCAVPKGSATLRTVAACGPCFCDDVCTLYQDCCPVVLLQGGIVYGDQKMASCVDTVPFPATSKPFEFNASKHQNMVSRCPASSHTQPLVRRGLSNLQNGTVVTSGWPDNDEMKLCEYPNISDINQALPVYSNDTEVIYRNEYCASCHNDTENISSWTTHILCLNVSPELMSRPKEGIYQTLMTVDGANSTQCAVHFAPFSFNQSFERTCSSDETNIISTCNVTGVWPIYDARVETACHMFTYVFKGKYKNMFCFLCNLEFIMDLNGLWFTVLQPEGSVARASFSILIDFEDSGGVTGMKPHGDNAAMQCSVNQIYDTFTRSCHTLHCSEDRRLSKNRDCVSTTEIGNVGYRLCSTLEVDTDTLVSLPDLDIFRLYLQRFQHFAYYRHIDTVEDWCPNFSSVTFKLVDYFAHTDDLEKLGKYVRKVIDYHKAFSATPLEGAVMSTRFNIVYPCFDAIENLTCPCLGDMSINFTVNDVYWKFPPDEDEIKLHFLDYHAVRTCPFIELSLLDFDKDYKENEYVHKKSNSSISMSTVKTTQSSVLICIADYLHMTGQTFWSNVKKWDTWTTAGLVSVICTCISLFCLLLTLVVYILLPPPVFGGDKNIITLIVTLFIAQAFYEFTLEQYENKTACKAFGITIHYTWLTAVFSMNACTVERFYKLCFPLRSRAFFTTRKPFILATAYTFIVPLIIVCVNLIVNFALRKELGYGSPRICYINNRISRAISFGVPMAVVLTANIVLMIITIWALRKTSDDNIKHVSQTKLGLVACVRLSIVTGLTWSLIFLYEVISNQAVSYVITALIGLQGALLFFSLTCNKRLLLLLCQVTPACKRVPWPGFCRRLLMSRTCSEPERPGKTSSRISRISGRVENAGVM